MPCPNCNYPTDESMKFCPQCGQEQEDRTSNMGSFIKHFLGDYFTFDSKIFKSVSPLLIKPGFLTTEFVAGRRVRYITPLRLYIFISILFFLMIRWFSPDTSQSPESNEWDKYFGLYLPRLFFVLLPLFALIMWLLHSKKNWSFVTHFVFSIHVHAFLFLSGSLYLLISEIFDRLSLQVVNWALAFIMLLWWLTYLFIAQKRVYALNTGKTIIRFLLLLLLYGIVLIVSSILTLALFA